MECICIEITRNCVVECQTAASLNVSKQIKVYAENKLHTPNHFSMHEVTLGAQPFEFGTWLKTTLSRMFHSYAITNIRKRIALKHDRREWLFVRWLRQIIISIEERQEPETRKKTKVLRNAIFLKVFSYFYWIESECGFYLILDFFLSSASIVG